MRPTGNWSPALDDREVALPVFLPRPPLPLPLRSRVRSLLCAYILRIAECLHSPCAA